MAQSARKYNIKPGESLRKRTDIIAAILASDHRGVTAALAEEPDSVNDLQEETLLNAVMLAADGRLPSFIETMTPYCSGLRFGHLDSEGRNLLRVALATIHKPTIDAVQALYEAHAPHLINNWPEPN